MCVDKTEVCLKKKKTLVNRGLFKKNTGGWFRWRNIMDNGQWMIIRNWLWFIAIQKLVAIQILSEVLNLLIHSVRLIFASLLSFNSIKFAAISGLCFHLSKFLNSIQTSIYVFVLLPLFLLLYQVEEISTINIILVYYWRHNTMSYRIS